MTSRTETFALTNARGMEVRVASLGGAILSIRVPDRDGRVADVVPGYESVEAPADDRRYFNVLIGRYANRIARGRFVLDGREYRLPVNDGPNHLHGGPRGFNRARWRVASFERAGATGLVLEHTSPDGDEGYPGEVVARVTYTLTDDAAFAIDYEATTSAASPVCLTQHTYFNLAGHDSGSVLGHELTIAATRFTPVDDTLIPTGELRGVRGTPLDFTRPRTIGERLEADDAQLRIARGYDHNFVLDRSRGHDVDLAATLRDPVSGRLLEIFTSEPGLQFYSGVALDEGEPGKGGHRYVKHAAIALETQHFPDSPNHPHFPTTILRPGQTLRSRTIYRFSAGAPDPA